MDPFLRLTDKSGSTRGFLPQPRFPHLNLVYSQLNKLLGSLPKTLESPFNKESGKPRKPPANPRREAEEPSKSQSF